MTTIYDAAILLVDDNPDLLTLVTDNLRTAGYKTVCTAADCAAARAAFAAHRPDLMILDINLPDGDGFGLFRTLRTESDVPALFLSARDADADRLFGLGLGADDYLTKPFLMQELLLRVQHLLQRAYRTELRRSRVLTLGDCTVNLQDAAVRRADGTTLALTATERALLQRLADDRGHIVTYDAVCEAVWGADYYGYENSLNVHIRHLREKIEPDPGHPQWLLTVRGGLCCPVFFHLVLFLAFRHAPFHDGKSLDTLITYYNTRKALFHYIVSRESMIFSNCFRLIWMRLPFRITQPAVGFSSASRRSLFSPIRKYLDASSMVSVYFSQIGTSLLLITWPPFFSKQRLFFAKVGRK